MPYCAGRTVSAYGLLPAQGPRGDLWAVLFAHPPSIAVGVAGGIISALIIGQLYSWRIERRFLSPSCGVNTHLHVPRRTTTGGRVYVCVPDTCGDDSHAHMRALSTTGEITAICVTTATHLTYLDNAAHGLLNLRKELPHDTDRPSARGDHD